MSANTAATVRVSRLALIAILGMFVIRTAIADPAGGSAETTNGSGVTTLPGSSTESSEPTGKSQAQSQTSLSQSNNVAPATVAGSSPIRTASPNRVIDEIIVTAQKREQNIQDVPISIAAFSGNQLDALGINNAKDLSTLVPGLQITDFAGYSMVYIRGVGTDSFFPSADPSVSTYIDGVYFPSGHTLGEGFGKVKRVEVLKGPQGTLFGRNSTGGAINIITEDPSFTPEAQVKVGYGRFDDFKTRAYVNVPLTDQFAVNVSGIYNNGQNYYSRDATVGVDAGKPVPRNKLVAGRVKLRYTPTESINLVLTFIESQQKGPSSSLSVNTMPSLVGSLLGIQPETRSYVTSNDTLPDVDNLTRAYYGIFTWKLPWIDTKLTMSRYKVQTSNFHVDFDGSPLPLVTSNGVYEFQKDNTAELTLTSNAGSWGAAWFKYTAGAYYYQSSGGYSPVQLAIADSVIRLPSGQIAQLVPPSLRDLLGFLPDPNKAGALLTGVVGAQSYSGYLQATATLTRWLGITLGGRYQQEKRNVIKSTIAEPNLSSGGGGGNDGGQLTLLSFPIQEDRRSSFTPKITFDFHLIDAVLLYASYEQGVKSATYNVVNVDKPPDFVKPEKVTAYEIGVKSTLLGGNLLLNGAIFQNSIKNLQISYVSLFSGGLATFLNVPRARIRGVEFDFQWAPLPDWDPGFVASGGGSYLDPRYTDYGNALGYDPTTGLATAGNDYSEDQIARTSRVTANLRLGQTIQTDIGPVELGADLSYTSGFYFEPSETAVDRQPSCLLLNAHVSYLYEPWNLRFTVFGANLTNKHYDISQFRTDFGRLDTLGPPITFGGSVTWTFQ